jgi:predicted transcriptional regulator
VEERLGAEAIDDFIAALLNHGEGERAHVLRDVLTKAYSNPMAAQVLVIRGADGVILGGVVRCEEDDRLLVTALRVPRAGSLADSVARQLAFLQRKHAADRRLSRVVVVDRAPSPSVRRTLPSEFFVRDEEIWSCSVEVGIVQASAVLPDDVTPERAAEYERQHWPVKVIGGEIPTYIIPIKPSFAEQLIDAELAGATLFARPVSLGLSREQVYYRSSATVKRLSGPARVLWYVTQKPGHPVAHVRAVSHLVDVVCDRPRTLHKRYSRLGVWSQEEVEDVAQGTGQAMALHVMDTERLESPLSLGELREIYAAEGVRFQPPQGPLPVSERMFCLLYGRSSAYA